jgi:hypothetical protein
MRELLNGDVICGKTEWRTMSRDYKGKLNGERAALFNAGARGTILTPVVLVKDDDPRIATCKTRGCTSHYLSDHITPQEAAQATNSIAWKVGRCKVRNCMCEQVTA